MTHKMNKDLQTIISTETSGTILGIPKTGNSITVASNKITINEDPDWNFDTACSHFEIQPWALDRRRIIHGGNFLNLLHRALAYFFWRTLVQKGGGFGEVCIVNIYLIDKLFNRSPLSLSSLIIHTMRNTGCDTTKSVTHGTRRTKCGSHHPKKIGCKNVTGRFSLNEDDNEANESYNSLDDEEDEAGAQSMISIDAFQTKMWTAFEQLWIN
ncbi:hypothetical protein M9H77_18457 [Catharanthus roseus]|uniref:Uncharacterized protein n=1 Tax=Catharanthus roseus TaxID=4058 RepID=A0ACC0B7K2_CATRO|nr:hypothetical protein M9H77_18457 [Catharanthus roseus]